MLRMTALELITTYRAFTFTSFFVILRHGFCGSCHFGVQAAVQNVWKKALIPEYTLTARTRAGFLVN